MNSWTPEEMEGDTEVSIWMMRQKRDRRRKVGIFVICLSGILLVTWIGIFALGQIAESSRRHDSWLQANGCKVTKRRESKWTHHFWGDYWEYIPGEVCYKCSKTGESFCEDT